VYIYNCTIALTAGSLRPLTKSKVIAEDGFGDIRCSRIVVGHIGHIVEIAAGSSRFIVGGTTPCSIILAQIFKNRNEILLKTIFVRS